jgi:hypothetical protein
LLLCQISLLHLKLCLFPCYLRITLGIKFQKMYWMIGRQSYRQKARSYCTKLLKPIWTRDAIMGCS